MERRWKIVVEKYDGAIKRGINEINKAIGDYVNYVVPVKTFKDIKKEDLEQSNLILIGKNGCEIFNAYKEKGILSDCTLPQSYSVYVGESPFNTELETVAISGYDDNGVLYGCMDFINKYLGDRAINEGYLYGENRFSLPFNQKNYEWKAYSSPKILTRAIWTWGHVIYDYEKFFLNMAKLKLNEIVIWNDKVPFNAKDIVDTAHSYGIKVIWGFAWGWSTKCAEFIKNLNDTALKALKDEIVSVYETQYKDTNADGIYFQSFTETDVETAGKTSVAEVVVNLVNETAGVLLERYPDLHIQFGLHATSVKNRLDIIGKTDKRIYIVWEDCGAFPYAYSSDNVSGFDKTLEFNEKLLSLRGDTERFGAVLKGMINLDWFSFEHFSESYILGARSEKFIKERSEKKEGIRKYVTGGWLKNADYALKLIRQIANKNSRPIVEFLLEDALFEDKIPLFTSFFSEILWSSDKDAETIFGIVGRFPCVDA